MSRYLFLWTLAVFSVLWSSDLPASNGPQTVPGYVHRTFDLEDGLPKAQISRVVRSRDGHLWIATLDGLARFDGRSAQVFHSDRYPAMGSDRIRWIHETGDGTLWIWTEQGYVSLYRAGEIFACGIPDAEGRAPCDLVGDSSELAGKHGRYGRPVEAPDGTIWIGSFSGLYRWTGEQLQREATIPETEVTRIVFPDSRGRVWAGTRHHLWLGRAGDFEKVDIGGQDGISAVVETPEGEFWALSVRGIGRVRNGRFTVEEEEGYLAVDAAGVLWSGRSDGLWRWTDGRWQRVAEPVAGIYTSLRAADRRGPDGSIWMSWGSTLWRNGEPAFELPEGPYITTLTVDEQGILWMPTSLSGVLHAFIPERVQTVAAGLEDTALGSVYEDRDGTLWVTRDADLALLGPGQKRFEVVTGPRRPITEFPTQVEPIGMLRDQSGTLWVATRRGLYSFHGTEYRGPHGPPDMHLQVPSLIEDAAGNLWVGTQFGLFQRAPKDGTWTRHTSEAIHERPIRFMLETSPGTLWLGTNGAGVVRFRDGVFTGVDQSRGLPSDLVRSLWQAPDGHLWIGTENRGLCRLNPSTVDRPEGPDITAVGRQHGLWSNVIHQIVDDGLGHLWLSSHQGLFRVELDALEAVADGDRDRLESVVFTEMDGMADREAAGGVQQSGLRDRQGRLWFPTKAGLVRVDPGHLELRGEPPQARLVSLSADGRDRPLTGEGLELSPDERSFTVTFTAPSFRAPERLRFRHRLKPYDDQWISAGERREARYTKVPPGSYVFEVAVNEDGVWSPDPARVPIEVEARFFETRWFFGLCGLLVVAMLVGGVRLREANTRARQRHLEREVEQRTATIAEQAEELRQLDRLKSELFANISHELRTPLTLMLGPLRDALDGAFGPLDARLVPQIEMATRNAENQLGLVEQLLDIARLDAGRLRLRCAPGDLVELARRRIDAFRNLAEQKDIELSVEEPELETWAVIDPVEMPKVVDNLLSNAIKFTPEGGRVWVRVRSKAPGWIELSVCDNGPGIAPADRERIFDRFHRADPTGRTPGTGLGLSLARRLVEMHGGRLELGTAESGIGACFNVILPAAAGRPEAIALDPAQRTGRVVQPLDSIAAAAPAETVPSAGIDGTEEDPELDVDLPVDLPVALVVDDHADIRAYIRRHLEPAYRIVEAGDGREALELARATPPDIVVSDVMMPEMDGLEFFRTLRSIPELTLVPVVLVTAKASGSSRLEGLLEGVDDYLVKPFEGRELRARIDNLLASRRRLLEGFEPPSAAHGNGLALPEIEPTPADESFLQRLQEILEARLGDPELNVGELARELSCSRSYLTNKVRELIGETPGAVIRTCRLERAALLIRADAGTIGEIAYAVGFKSVAHFSNAFRRHFGERPSTFAAQDHDILRSPFCLCVFICCRFDDGICRCGWCCL